MKKIIVLALSAILVANISAQEQRKEAIRPSKEERVEFEIERLTNELLLSDQQAEKFATLYREYAGKLDEIFKNQEKIKPEEVKPLTDEQLDKRAKQRFENTKAIANVQAKYYDKFRKDLSARQVEKVMRLEKPCCEKHGCKDGPKDGFKVSPKEGFKDGDKPMHKH